MALGLSQVPQETREKEAVPRKGHLETGFSAVSKDTSLSGEPSVWQLGPLLACMCCPGSVTTSPFTLLSQFGQYTLWPCLTGPHTLWALALTPPQRGLSHRP